MTSSDPTGSAPRTSGTPSANAPGPPAGGAIGTAPPRPSPTRRRARTTGRSLALALLIFVTVVLVLFVVFNTQAVEVSLVFGTVHLALIVALLLAAVLGGLLVMLATFVVRARSKPRE
jgi:uncharacterized integral membrane protein